jgi:hypothetical protein
MDQLQQADDIWQAADDLWQAELVKAYGKQACSMRYLVQGQGEDESTLRAAYVARRLALRAWHDNMHGNDGA